VSGTAITRRLQGHTAASRTGLCTCAALAALGCYTYAPSALEAVPVGTGVRALLSTEAQLALRDSVGMRQQTVHGTLLQRDGDRFLLALRAGDREWAVGSHALYQRVALTSRDVLQVEVRRFQRARTTALLLGIAAAATIVTIKVLRKGNPGMAGPPGGGPPE
jgi:hypothetical protein